MATSPLKETELAFLQKLTAGNWKLKDGVAAPTIQALIDRGYCRTDKERLGPVGVYTGDIFIRLTEAGTTTLSLTAAAGSAPGVQPSVEPGNAAVALNAEQRIAELERELAESIAKFDHFINPDTQPKSLDDASVREWDLTRQLDLQKRANATLRADRVDLLRALDLAVGEIRDAGRAESAPISTIRDQVAAT